VLRAVAAHRGVETLAGHESQVVKATAADCGFSHLQHFSTSFRQATGMTLSAFRRETEFGGRYDVPPVSQADCGKKARSPWQRPTRSAGDRGLSGVA
jgi:AraC-like DNA-binding protein